MKCSIIKYLIVAVIFFSCGLPKATVQYSSTEKITCGPGPEDIVLDTITDKNAPRIIASCSERRKEDISTNGFYSIDINTKKCTKLLLKNVPASQAEMRPHGIDLVLENDGVLRLYAINHNDKVNKQYVVKFKVFKDYLEFENEYWNKIMVSPNDVAGYKDGSFYITNDAAKRGNLTEQLLKLKKGNVVKCKNDDYSIFSKRYAYTNGIMTTDSGIFVSTTRQNKMFFVDYKTQKKKLIGKGKGEDNITHDNGKLYVACHLKQIKFIKHVKDSTRFSPTVIYAYDLETKKRKCVFSNKGDEISASSTAIMYKGKLYVSQVFNSYVLVKTIQPRVNKRFL